MQMVQGADEADFDTVADNRAPDLPEATKRPFDHDVLAVMDGGPSGAHDFHRCVPLGQQKGIDGVSPPVGGVIETGHMAHDGDHRFVVPVRLGDQLRDRDHARGGDGDGIPARGKDQRREGRSEEAG